MKHLLSLLIILVLSVPTLAFAQGIVPCDGPDCQACHVVELGQNLLMWFIGIMATFIALVFVIGGLQMVMSGGNTEGVSKAKEMMTNAVVGFLILLASWLIVDTVLKMFIDNQKLGVWYEVKCMDQRIPTVPGVPTATTTPPVTAACTDDAALITRYRGSPVGVVAPGLQTMISCYLADPAVAEATDQSQLYTVDRSHPRCSLTNGNPVCEVCSHSVNSCHYGRGSGEGAKAVDFNAKSGFTEAQLHTRLQARKAQCGGTVALEGNHTHISMPGC